jgi:hypothetical protein
MIALLRDPSCSSCASWFPSKPRETLATISHPLHKAATNGFALTAFGLLERILFALPASGLLERNGRERTWLLMASTCRKAR